MVGFSGLDGFLVFFFFPRFLPYFVCVCGCACGGEREMEHVMSVMFVRCRNSSLLHVFSILEAHISYFKYPGSLHRIQT